MASWDDVSAKALALPEVTEVISRQGLRGWRVRDKPFAWERPLRKADYEALGDTAPDGPILGVRVPDLVAKEALLAEEAGFCFTTPHFDGYPAILVLLDDIPLGALEELVVEAWATRAPKRLLRDWEAERG
ncbi:MAG: MmcQ/YjbR family DNA-binding protein [Acidimicrobiia bacterium]